MISFKALAYGCWFSSSHDWLRERDGKTLILRCQNCGSQRTPDLSKDAYRGSAHTPADVLGKPIGKVVRESQRTRLFGNWRA